MRFLEKHLDCAIIALTEHTAFGLESGKLSTGGCNLNCE